MIRSPLQIPAGMPIQSVAAKGVAGMIELAPTYVNGTPLLDIKLYVPAFDVREATGIGWFAHRPDQVDHVQADQRFS